MATTRKHPKVFLRNGSGQLISLYRCVLYHKKTPPNTPAELFSFAEQAKNYTQVAVVMLAGGHFSAAIFNRTEPVVHKTFHRYVVRAKRGTVQSVRDNQGSAPKSGGASLRRYNEAALTQEVQELLTGWSQHLQSCHLIFLRTSAYSRHIFFSGKCPVFSKDDPRVRTIPFTTGRPTFNEAKRVHQMLMSVECFGEESLVTSFVPVSPPRHLHPQTGQLVVRPDTTCTHSPGDPSKGKGRKARGDRVEGKAEKGHMELASESQKVATNTDDDNTPSDVEVELVEVVEVIRTDDLQEFACSVNAPKRNKKKKRGGQKGAEKQAADTSTQPENHVMEAAELSEEDILLKNRLYTCCKSGDVSQLSHLLKQLVLVDHSHHKASPVNQHQSQATVKEHQSSVSTVSHHQNSVTTVAQHEHSLPEPSSISSQDSHSQATCHIEISGTADPIHVIETEQDCIEKTNELDSIERRSEPDCIEKRRELDNIKELGKSHTADCQNSRPAQPCTVWTSIPSNCQSAARSEIGFIQTRSCDTHASENRSSSESSSSLTHPHNTEPCTHPHNTEPCTHSHDTDASKNSSGSESTSSITHLEPCQNVGEEDDVADSLDMARRARFERVVLGLYGERQCSLLHIAATAGHTDVIMALLEAGCDPSVRDGNGKTAYTLTTSKDVRNAFRRFRGNFPDRYDYESAQIPSALTVDMEVERKQREAEKRKLQKKAKQERLRERKAEEAKAAQEQKAKDRFLALSDREKRALAAEKRLLVQASGEGVTVVLNRCFQCAVDISGKVPFEYMQFHFCSPKCLKEHRMKPAK